MTTPAAWKGEPLAEPPTLLGHHVRLEPLSLDHASDLHLAGDSPEIWSYLAETRGAFTSLGDAAEWIGRVLAEHAAGVRLPFAIVSITNGAAVGSTSYFFETRWANRTLEIGGTWLSPRCWRTAVNTECKYLLLRYAFETLGANRVELMTDARNARSQKAIERLGATREGVLRGHMLYPDGHLRDSIYYGILQSEWPRVKQKLESALAPTEPEEAGSKDD